MHYGVECGICGCNCQQCLGIPIRSQYRYERIDLGLFAQAPEEIRRRTRRFCQGCFENTLDLPVVQRGVMERSYVKLERKMLFDAVVEEIVWGEGVERWCEWMDDRTIDIDRVVGAGVNASVSVSVSVSVSGGGNVVGVADISGEEGQSDSRMETNRRRRRHFASASSVSNAGINDNVNILPIRIPIPPTVQREAPSPPFFKRSTNNNTWFLDYQVDKDDVAVVIAYALMQPNCQYEHLDLSAMHHCCLHCSRRGVGFGLLGYKALAIALSVNTSLKTIVFSDDCETCNVLLVNRCSKRERDEMDVTQGLFAKALKFNVNSGLKKMVVCPRGFGANMCKELVGLKPDLEIQMVY